MAVTGRKAPGCSNLVLFLHAKEVDIKQVIGEYPSHVCQCFPATLQKLAAYLNNLPLSGMEFLWECRGICLGTFYLCESCEETISNCDICQHMTSQDHQLKYMVSVGLNGEVFQDHLFKNKKSLLHTDVHIKTNGLGNV